ncbi:MAG: recombinase family protein [Oscillospiraceae bacterium]|jgi:DNA invertase Pin-like site-specific DNA recombinase|nr:recombinase family protein [Oscillospiraceae bacterium]
MTCAPNVTVIPATLTLQEGLNANLRLRELLRTAGYARVSTGSEEQLTSYTAQVEYYTKLIREHPDWQFVEVYTDPGLSGTSLKKRDGFNRMIADALNGKIDMIIIKSISRFARNTVDALATIHSLKAKGVDVFFETENIHTMDGNSEFIVSVLASVAQKESEDISQNVTWGHRKRFADGKVTMSYGSFLGYEKGEDDQPQIVEEEAVIIREIYALFLAGKTIRQIAKTLMERGIPTPRGKLNWTVSTVKSILQNEKYAGNALLQKGFTVDFLSKTVKKNEGEVPQYFVENSHPAIISPETFELVQSEMQRRAKLGKQLTSTDSSFTGKVFCQCGALYGTKLWRDHSGNEKIVWQCKGRNRGVCAAPYLTEEQFRVAFVRAYNELLGDKNRYISALEELCAELTDTKTLDADIAASTQELTIVAELMQRAIEENAHSPLDQRDYQLRYNAMRQRFEVEKSKQDSLTAQRRERTAKRAKIRKFVEDLCQQENLITEFDEQAWNALAEQITVHSEKELTVRFRDGSEVKGTK